MLGGKPRVATCGATVGLNLRETHIVDCVDGGARQSMVGDNEAQGKSRGMATTGCGKSIFRKPRTENLFK